MLAKKRKQKWMTCKRRRSSLIEKPSMSDKILLQDINCVGKHRVAKMAFNGILFSLIFRVLSITSGEIRISTQEIYTFCKKNFAYFKKDILKEIQSKAND